MKDYSYSELKDMQERAMERVKTMQQRAKETADAANDDLTSQNSTEQHTRYKEKNYEPPASRNQNTRPHHIKMPAGIPKRDSEYESFKEYFGKENSTSRATQSQQNKVNLIESVLNEPDKAMLFSLLLLMRAEGSNEALMMALLYIMS